jgi:hypothetical protein
MFAAVAVAMLGQLGCADTNAGDAVAERQRAVEGGLLPGVVVAGEAIPKYTIAARMERYRVPGISVAVINDGKLEWARG